MTDRGNGRGLPENKPTSTQIFSILEGVIGECQALCVALNTLSDFEDGAEVRLFIAEKAAMRLSHALSLAESACEAEIENQKGGA